MYKKVKAEHKQHGHLMKMLRKHFGKDESEMESDMEHEGSEHESEDEDDEQVKPMQLYQSKSDRRASINKKFDKETKPHGDVYGSDGESTDEDRMYGENAESNDDGYSSLSPENEGEYESKMKEEEDDGSQPMLPKSQRKRMSIAVLTRKMSKPKKSY